jgi:CcmD family protein
MTSTVRLVAICLLVLMSAAPASIHAHTQAPTQQEGFVPIDQLPPQEQLPAAPLLVGAYSFVLLMLFGYMVSVSRRLSTIQREMDRLESDVKRGGKG